MLSDKFDPLSPHNFDIPSFLPQYFNGGVLRLLIKPNLIISLTI